MRVANYCVWLVVAVLAIYTGYVLRRSPVAQARPAGDESPFPQPTPYVLERSEINYTPDGKAEHAGMDTEAVRSDGSMVEQYEFFRGDIARARRTIYSVSGEIVELNEVLERKTTRPGAVRPQPTRNPRTNCVTGRNVKITGEEVIGEESIGGYRAVKIRSGSETTWWAPDLGCARVQIRLDLPWGYGMKVLKSVTVGEPPSELFQVPNRFTEVPPSRLFAAGTPDPLRMRGVDDAYYASRKHDQQ